MELDQRYIEDCFIKYAKVDMRSDVSSKQVLTTPGQKKLALIVCDDLKKLGVRIGIFETSGIPMFDKPKSKVALAAIKELSDKIEAVDGASLQCQI